MTDQSRVIVGAHLSLTGLRALREAVATARIRGVELRVVRAYTPRVSWNQSAPWFAANECVDPLPWAQGREAVATAVVRAAFEQALGGMAPDIPMSIVTLPGPARHALIDQVTREDDLIVVGASRRWHWLRTFRRTTGRYLALRSICPVLVVPQAAAVRQLGANLRWWRVRARREIGCLLAGPLADTTRSQRS